MSEEHIINKYHKKMKKTRSYCAVPDCKSKISGNADYSYHRFPQSDKYEVNAANDFGDVEKVDLYSQWKKVTNIPNPGPSDRICSRHFTAADYFKNGVPNQRRRLKCNAIPSLHLPIINKERDEINEKRHTMSNENNVPEPIKIQSTNEAGEDVEMVQMMIEGDATNILPKVAMSEDIEVKTTIEHDLQDVGVQATIKNDSQDVGVQATIENNSRDFEVQVQSGELMYNFTDFIKNDAQLNTMTGIENFGILTCIENLISVIKISKNDSRVTMTLRDKIVMTFTKLKQNMSFSCLSIMFNCHTTKNCATIFEDTICLLSLCMKHAIPWPSRLEISKNIPLSFSNFTDVRVVLDWIEIFIQTPSKLCCELVTYSHCKNSNTIKFMTGVTPAGLISFISQPYGGRASDELIFEQSNIVNLLEPGDGIMVDRGFLIDEICSLNKWKCIRPPFLTGKQHFERSDAILTAEIAKAQVHIKLINQRIKDFKILSDPLPSDLVPFIEEISTVICAIINLSAPILSNDEFLNI